MWAQSSGSADGSVLTGGAAVSKNQTRQKHLCPAQVTAGRDRCAPALTQVLRPANPVGEAGRSALTQLVWAGLSSRRSLLSAGDLGAHSDGP